MICLDTNVVIAFLKRNPPNLVARIERELLQDALALPVVVLFELQFGVAKSARRRENTDRLAIFLQLPVNVVPFDSDDAREAGEIRADLGRAGTAIGPCDLLIAAQARRRGAVLVTANVREFAHVSGLNMQDWSLPG